MSRMVSISDELYTHLKRRAVDQSISLEDFLEHLIRRELDREGTVWVDKRAVREEIGKVTRALQGNRVRYDPDMVRSVREISRKLQEHPPHESLKAFMEASRGRPYDRD